MKSSSTFAFVDKLWFGVHILSHILNQLKVGTAYFWKTTNCSTKYNFSSSFSSVSIQEKSGIMNDIPCLYIVFYHFIFEVHDIGNN